MKNRLKELKKLSKDALAKEMWSGNDQFADLFNALVYHRQQLNPDELSDTNTDLSTLIADKEFAETIRKYRDVSKLSANGECYQILAIENQAAIHYAMPFRCLLYDVLSFMHQYKEIAAKNKKEGNIQGNEFLSGFTKKDRFINCRTIVFYYGDKKWDAATKLSDLVEFQTVADRNAFNDYNMELICLNDLDVENCEFKDKKTRDFFLFTTSVLKNGFRNIPKELSDMDLETAYIAASLTGTEAQLSKMLQEQSDKGKETIDMCNAVMENLKEVHDKSYAAGEAKGEARGEARGEAKMKKAILSLHMNGMDIETISKMTGLPLDEVKAYVL